MTPKISKSNNNKNRINRN